MSTFTPGHVIGYIAVHHVYFLLPLESTSLQAGGASTRTLTNIVLPLSTPSLFAHGDLGQIRYTGENHLKGRRITRCRFSTSGGVCVHQGWLVVCIGSTLCPSAGNLGLAFYLTLRTCGQCVHTYQDTLCLLSTFFHCDPMLKMWPTCDQCVHT